MAVKVFENKDDVVHVYENVFACSGRVAMTDLWQNNINFSILVTKLLKISACCSKILYVYWIIYTIPLAIFSLGFEGMMQ